MKGEKIKPSVLLGDNRGRFVVEAAVIIPLILMVIALIFRFTMFAYDMCRLEWASHAAALRASQMLWENNTKRSEMASDTIDNLAVGHLILGEEIEQSLNFSGDDITIELAMGNQYWEFQTQSKKKVCNPYAFIHNYRILKNYAGINEAAAP